MSIPGGSMGFEGAGQQIAVGAIEVMALLLKELWFLWVPFAVLGVMGFLLRLILIEVGARRGWNLYWFWHR